MIVEKNGFQSSIAIHPGRTLEEILETTGMKQIELAERSGLTPKTINEIVQGKNPITPETAIKLASVFGMSVTFWNNLQRDYEETLSRLKAEGELQRELSHLSRFTCYKELAKWGYIEDTKEPKQKVRNLLNFFGVSSLNFIPKIQEVAFRNGKEKNLSSESLAAWLRCGELEAKKIETANFDKAKLLGSIEKLRNLTNQESPEILQTELVEICASFGVAIVLIPYFSNTNVTGATRWINQDKALIQLNLKGHWVDSFWFSFFHELGHLVKHGKKEQFIEFKNVEDANLKEKEKEAEEFAKNTLIPKHEYETLLHECKTLLTSKSRTTELTIQAFAKKQNIAPCIVAGRLAFDLNAWNKFGHTYFKEKDKVEVITFIHNKDDAYYWGDDKIA